MSNFLPAALRDAQSPRKFYAALALFVAALCCIAKWSGLSLNSVPYFIVIALFVALLIFARRNGPVAGTSRSMDLFLVALVFAGIAFTGAIYVFNNMSVPLTIVISEWRPVDTAPGEPAEFRLVPETFDCPESLLTRTVIVPTSALPEDMKRAAPAEIQKWAVHAVVVIWVPRALSDVRTLRVTKLEVVQGFTPPKPVSPRPRHYSNGTEAA